MTVVTGAINSKQLGCEIIIRNPVIHIIKKPES